jgi:hypothetical protein
MRRLTVWTAAAVILACGAIAAHAAKADKPKKSPEERFARLDVNGDKKLSSEEFVGKKTGDAKGKAEKRFGRLDKDSDNFLSLEEFSTPPKKKKK